MLDSFDYLVSLFSDFISQLNSLYILPGISLLGFIVGFSIIIALIVFLFGGGSK